MVRKHPSANNGRGGSPSGPKIQVRNTVWVDRGGFAAKWDGYGLRLVAYASESVPIPTLAFRWALTRRRSQRNHWESASPIKP
jgi:hypothetical protein